MFDANTVGADDNRFQLQFVVILSGGKILAANLGNYQENPSDLQFFIAMSRSSQELNAADLKKVNVIGVVEAALAVCFLIPHADRDFMFSERQIARRSSHFCSFKVLANLLDWVLQTFCKEFLEYPIDSELGMSTGEDSGAGIAQQTMRGRDYPTIRQFTVFLENRVGQLLEVIRRFERTTTRIVAMNIHDCTECSIVRFVLTNPEQAREVFERAGLAMIESDLIGIELGSGEQPLLNVCTALLQAEVNLVQAYPLMIRSQKGFTFALMVDNLEQAQATLAHKGIRMITESELAEQGEF